MSKRKQVKEAYGAVLKACNGSKKVALDILSQRFEISTVTVDRYLRKDSRGKKKLRETIVGIIGDTHLPYELDGYMDWCKSIFDSEGVNKVVHIGDLFDNHALSFHDSEPALKGAKGEYIDALERLEPWKETFPQMIHINGNHDAIPARQLT